MKKVLILGSDGNLGGQLLKTIGDSSDTQVFAYNRKDLDLLDYDSIVPKISRIRPDIIINTASYNAVDRCEEFEDEFKLAKKINGETLKFLGKAAIKNNSVLVHYSSDYVFGGDICEEDGCGDDCLLSFKEEAGLKKMIFLAL